MNLLLSVRPKQIQIVPATTFIHIAGVVRKSTLFDPRLDLVGRKLLFDAKQANFGDTLTSAAGSLDIPEITSCAHCQVVVVPDRGTRLFEGEVGHGFVFHGSPFWMEPHISVRFFWRLD